ncbi:TIGR00730 family Rossman fold protein [Desulfovibrio mangrovi]|uniref:LOG family protein n=1 Tax=Desulfovibrio mangrovi TaxID=2976983 RepID=UPI0022468459|nr:TIGR00730 family Rossman fold protein [Desulfovibrio mangrovi]UZP66768.1 TIGR00730 family Rossman fold protein [Desulfovibrio mangrovi]
MQSICIFLGASCGNDPIYMDAASAMGRELAARGITCVYGGSCTGLMNRLADSALEAGGRVVGVTVQALKDKEEFHRGLSELHVMPTMHARKKLMFDLSEAFIALPGGIGTYEEFFEVYTHRQMGLHSKPCALLNVNGFYSPMELMMRKAAQEGFMKTPHEESILIAETPAEMLDRLLGLPRG